VQATAIENGLRALASRSEIVALADALQVAPSELTRIEVPAPSNGVTDMTVEAVRVAFMGIDHDQPGGAALPVEALHARVFAVKSFSCTTM
jgi:hypothetical protein